MPDLPVNPVPVPTPDDPALLRGNALRQDMQALRTLQSLVTLPEVAALADPEAHAQALRYLVDQSIATMEAFIDWQNTIA